jgi:glycosyltransferase involved in cell wall biosynthesis
LKVVVFAHRLEVGGSQLNAIDLATGLRDRHGFDVVLFATPGRLTDVVEQRALRYVPAPDARLHPSLARMRALRQLVREEKPDLVHAWDWWQCLDAYYSVHLPLGIPMMVSAMTMDITRLLPKQMWTTFGTPELVDQARAQGRGKVDLIVPPVDMHANAPDAVDAQAFRRHHGVRPDEILVVTASRLSVSTKSESLMRTIDAMRALGRDFPLRFLIVGEGTARSQLETLAAQANAQLGREAVSCVGALLDPREAYAAADIVVGMGSSAVRGLAFGKPTIVVGEQGFCAPFDARTAPSFYYKGFYGLGDGDPGSARLTELVRVLAASAAKREADGAFSRRFAVDRFSLETACDRLAGLCRRAVSDKNRLGTTAGDALRTTAVYLRERRWLTPSRDRQVVDAVDQAAV